MSGKRVLALADQHEQQAALQPMPIDGSGKPPNKGVTTDQTPRLPYCVLVIDEPSTIRGMVKACLEREGMLVFDFPDGLQPLQCLEEKICKPHVVLLDVDVSQENWLSLVHYVRYLCWYALQAEFAVIFSQFEYGGLESCSRASITLLSGAKDGEPSRD